MVSFLGARKKRIHGLQINYPLGRKEPKYSPATTREREMDDEGNIYIVLGGNSSLARSGSVDARKKEYLVKRKFSSKRRTN